MNDEIKNVFSLFFDDTPITIHLIDTSRGDADFRATFIIETAVGSKYVLKLADNDFTFPEKISVWQRESIPLSRFALPPVKAPPVLII